MPLPLHHGVAVWVAPLTQQSNAQCTHTHAHRHTAPQNVPAPRFLTAQEVDLCRSHFITGFPSIRVFRKGHDDIYIQVGLQRARVGCSARACVVYV